MSHGNRIERIAIVGPERWRTKRRFAAADLRKAAVEFFVPTAVANARDGLSL